MRSVNWCMGLGVVVSALTLPVTAQAQQGKQVTFSKDVAPIFQAKCQSCHEPGSIAPMSLVTFRESRPWARSIKARVEARQMPPWHIDRSVGVRDFKNDSSLTDAEVATIAANNDPEIGKKLAEAKPPVPRPPASVPAGAKGAKPR